MAEAEVTVPKIGKVNKKWVWGAVAVVGVYVGYKWYSNAGASTADDTTYTTPDVGEGVDASGVVGSGGVSGNTQYAGTTTDGTSTTVIDTNAEWTQEAAELLSNAGYDPVTVYGALGDYLAGKALTSSESTIVRAAIAAVGNPPVGTHTITESVGDTTLAAPANVKVDSTTSTTAHLTWSAVTGAQSYKVYRSDTGSTVVGTGASNSATVAGLTPNKSYGFQVAAVSTLGKDGNKSSTATGKTTGASLTAPTGLKVRSAATTSIQLQWTAVTGAGGYMIQQSGGRSWESTDAADTAVGLKSKTSYKFRVAALQPGTRTPGPWSGWLTAKTK